jgi:hypothetical protein
MPNKHAEFLTWALPHALTVMGLTLLLDASLYAVFPMVEMDDADYCPDFTAGCAWRVVEMPAGIEYDYAAVRVPMFSVEMHEMMHSRLHIHDELAPSLLSLALELLFFLTVVSVYNVTIFRDR